MDDSNLIDDPAHQESVCSERNGPGTSVEEQFLSVSSKLHRKSLFSKFGGLARTHKFELQNSFRREKEGALRMRNNYSYEDYTTVSPETRKPPSGECKGVTIRVAGKGTLKSAAHCSYITLKKREGKRVA